MRNSQDREKFLETLGLKNENLVMGEQIHGVRIARVKDSNKKSVLIGIDGLVSKGTDFLQGVPLQSLGVTFADCVPLLAVDPKAHIIGTAHAGWKGTLAGIARELVTTMEKAGAKIPNVYVSVGPHIGMCCYNVLEDRAQAFIKQFGNNEKIATRIQGAWQLDIGYANYELLLESGIIKEHIDAPIMCTSCQVDQFNSFRKDPKDRFGVQMGVISL